MRYELYLRSQKPPADLPSRLLAFLEAEGPVTPLATGGWEHEDPGGAVAVNLHPPADPRWQGGKGEGPLGLDLSIPGGSGAKLAARLADLAFAWAKLWSLQVFDPQLGRLVTEGDQEAVTDRIRQQAGYLAETVGLGDMATSHMDVDPSGSPLSFRARFYLGLAALLLLLGLVAHYCS